MKKELTILGFNLYELILLFLTLIVIGAFIVFSSNNKVEIKFDSNGGTEIGTIKVRKNSIIKKPTEPVKEGYEFNGWMLNNELFDFTSKVSKDITLVANWTVKTEKTYKITFDSNGGYEVDEISVENGKINNLPTPTKEGYKFIGWFYNDNELKEGDVISEDVTIVARWEANTIEEKYTVTFDSNGGTNVSKQEVSSVATKPKEPTKEGYVFIEWTLDGKSYDFSTKVTKDITLKAKWEVKERVKQYTVTFDSNGGTSVSKQVVTENKTATTPKEPIKKGYKFIGWYLGDSKYSFGTKVIKDITLKAKWEVKEEVKQYTVTFDSNGGTSVSKQVVTENKTATTPKEPTKKGYKFIGWYLGDSKYSFGTKVTKDITLKAKWEYVPNVTYKVEDLPGSIVGQQKIYILKDGVKTEGYIDITTSKGKKTAIVPVTGLEINKNKILKIENARLSN